MKRFIYLLLSLFLLFNLNPNEIAASRFYPGTSILIRVGDIITRHKSLNNHKLGHVAIVGEDLKVYHSIHYALSGGIGEYLEEYTKKCLYKARMHVYRPSVSISHVFAGKWAQQNVHLVQKYDLKSLDMGDISKNYCSKFVWQAYYFGAGVNIDKPTNGAYLHRHSQCSFEISAINFSEHADTSLFSCITDFNGF